MSNDELKFVREFHADAKERELVLEGKIEKWQGELREAELKLRNAKLARASERCGVFKPEDLQVKSLIKVDLSENEQIALNLDNSIGELEGEVAQLKENIAKAEARIGALAGEVATKTEPIFRNRLSTGGPNFKRHRPESDFEANISVHGGEEITCTAGRLSESDVARINKVLSARTFSNWDPTIEAPEIPIVGEIGSLTDLFAAASGQHNVPLGCLFVENRQDYSLSYSYVHTFDNGKSTTINVTSARPDFLIYQTPTELNLEVECQTLLDSKLPIIVVEVQSGGKDEKFGYVRLRLALHGLAQRMKVKRKVFGLYIRKVNGELGAATLMKLENIFFHIDGEFTLKAIPNLCVAVLKRCA